MELYFKRPAMSSVVFFRCLLLCGEVFCLGQMCFSLIFFVGQRVERNLELGVEVTGDVEVPHV